MDLSVAQTCLALAALGVFSHLSFFIRMDALDSAPTLGLLLLTIPALLTLALNALFAYTYINALTTASAWVFSYLGGTFASTLIYRMWFHPLRHYEGPFWSKLTQFHHVVNITKRVDHFRRVDALHEKHGDYVRIGPNLLSVADPAIVDVVHGPHTAFYKGNWYQGGKPLTTLHQMTDHAMHDRRRKHGWDKAFTTKSLRSYDARLIKYSTQLVNQIQRQVGQPIDARTWVNYFAFDVMGDLAFGKGFAALEKGESHFFINLIHDAGIYPGLLGSAPWLLHCITKLPIPSSLNAFVKMVKYSEKMVDERKTYKPEEPDVMSHLFAAGDFFDDPTTEKLLLTGDARLLIVAGSDTTAATLTYSCYHFAKDKSLVTKLRDELEAHNIRNDENFSVLGLIPLQYLNGFISEVLRLHPPVAGGVYRMTPKEGVTINGHFIPSGTVVLTPQYTIHRSPKAWVEPNELIPERWTTRPELIIDKSAWFPFLAGRYGCIGKQLAMSELRTVIAKLILEFDMSFAPGEDGRALLEDSEDTFTTACAKLELVFTPRKE